ncbi:hypothetical protein DEJ50_14105 [Streptomyces venezuelae]|uniref:Uncharacterized protein n=1 Tax=Streptomyces venezuelae TaxID=54571 RepID=A0A5P2D0W6_STRVZ|nr:hypothetical protein [Streptomyces venezuelae]QES48784.1 hypothetical protein DEJ50_14105 [Streptomyces venezuelae]
MVTSHHEAAHRIFQDRPELLAPVFRILGVPLPAKAVVEVLTADVTEIRPLERRVDSVLRIEPPDGEGGFLLAIEAQGRRDPDKAVSWAYYLSYLTAKYELPALLLVVCQDRATAGWAAGPFRLGLDEWTALALHPLVLGPDNVPVITDPEEAARDLPLAAFSAMTHGRNRNAPAILKALARALGTLEADSVTYYSELLEIGLGHTPARDTWRNLMNVGTYFPGRGTLVEETYLKGRAEGMADGKAEGKVIGRAEGLAEGRVAERGRLVLLTLENRRIPTLAETRERITSCTDLDTLGRWLERALTVTDAEDLFREDD